MNAEADFGRPGGGGGAPPLVHRCPRQPRLGLLRSLFVDDATSDWFGVRRQSSADEIVGYIQPIFAHLSKTHHILGAFRTTVDGDTAEVRSKGRAYHVGTGPAADLFEESLCEYRIVAVRTAGGWRIAHLAEKLFVMLGTDAVFRRPEGGGS
ncbi:MAG TPA: nuclear transport factor 2 family protein [Acidimicrobiia bacterium]|nr:nuclear transport factor 2 family protein [Acidimicrobiia bacterium]